MAAETVVHASAGGAHGSLGCVRQAGLEASHAAGQHTAQAVGVEAAAKHLPVNGPVVNAGLSQRHMPLIVADAGLDGKHERLCQVTRRCACTQHTACIQ